MIILETERLQLCQFSLDDAAFIVQLLNSPGWLQFIGDRKIRNEDDARQYLQNVPMTQYAKHGFGLWLVRLKNDHTPIGMCGLIRRDTLDDVDIGFALLPEYAGKGYAYEAAAATLAFAREQLNFKRLLAITNTDNASSVRLLEKIGLKYEKNLRLPGEDADVLLFSATF